MIFEKIANKLLSEGHYDGVSLVRQALIDSFIVGDHELNKKSMMQVVDVCLKVSEKRLKESK